MKAAMSAVTHGAPLEAEIESARLAAIVSSSDDAIVSKDLNGIVNSWNAAAERIFGYTAQEMIGRHITTIIPEYLHPEETHIISKIKRGERIEHFDTVRVAKGGRSVHVSLTVSPLRNSRDEIVGASKIARDIGERKRHEEMQTLLVHELNHRTKNLLATVQAIVLQTFRDASPDTMKLFRDRVQALVVNQDLLTKSGWRGASLSNMLAAVLAPFSGDNSQIRIAQGPQVHLSLRQTNALSMSLHELATNALKYGALSTSEGRVDISWQVDGELLTLRWRESNGPVVINPLRSGFGTQVLKFALQHELNAEVDIAYEPAGLRFTARLPLMRETPEVE